MSLWAIGNLILLLVVVPVLVALLNMVLAALERIRAAADDALAGGVALIGELNTTPELLANRFDQIVEGRALTLDEIDLRRHPRLQFERTRQAAIDIHLSDEVGTLTHRVGKAVWRNAADTSRKYRRCATVEGRESNLGRHPGLLVGPCHHARDAETDPAPHRFDGRALGARVGLGHLDPAAVQRLPTSRWRSRAVVRRRRPLGRCPRRLHRRVRRGAVGVRGQRHALRGE